MKKLFILFSIPLFISISLFSSEQTFSWQKLVTSWVITSDCYETSQEAIVKLQHQHVVRNVYRGVDNSEYVTIEFAQNWVRNFRRMRTKELKLYRAKIVQLLEKEVDDRSIQVYTCIIRKREEEELTFQEFLMRYKDDFVRLKSDIDRTESNLFGISY